jgi:formate hydrogenlyase subunit 4
VLLVDLFLVLFVPRLDGLGPTGALYLGVSIALITLLTAIAAVTARLTVNGAFQFYWKWGGLAAGAAIVAAVMG